MVSPITLIQKIQSIQARELESQNRTSKLKYDQRSLAVDSMDGIPSLLK